MVRAVHGGRSSVVLYRALLLLLSLCVASSQDGTDSTCFGGSCAEPAPGAAQFRSAAAADEELHSRERTERERVLQQKLLSGQRRRQSAFVGRNAVGSVADSWGRERTGSAAPPQQREAPPTPPPPPGRFQTPRGLVFTTRIPTATAWRRVKGATMASKIK